MRVSLSNKLYGVTFIGAEKECWMDKSKFARDNFCLDYLMSFGWIFTDMI